VIPQSLNLLAFIATQRGALGHAMALREEAYAVAQSSGSIMLRHRMAMQIGNSCRDRRDLAAALRWYDESLALARETGSVMNIGFVLWNMGNALNEMGEHARALASYEERLAMMTDPGALWLTYVRNQLGAARACLALGDLAAARRHRDLALEQQRPGHSIVRAEIDVGLAEVRAAEGAHEEAERMFRGAIATLATTELGQSLADARYRYARVLMSRGRYAEARPLLEQVRAFYTDPVAFRWRELLDELLKKCEQVAAS
jgi:tetratricopeptide (TPR) repeat protein